MSTELKVVNLGGAYPQSPRPLVSFKFKKCVNFPHLYNLQNLKRLGLVMHAWTSFNIVQVLNDSILNLLKLLVNLFVKSKSLKYETRTHNPQNTHKRTTLVEEIF